MRSWMTGAAVAAVLLGGAACTSEGEGAQPTAAPPESVEATTPSESIEATTPSEIAEPEVLAPAVVLDERENFYPTNVRCFVEDPRAVLQSGSGEAIAAGEALTLELLGGGYVATANDTITVADRDGWLGAGCGEIVVYERIVDGGDGYRYYQYWYFWVYNEGVVALHDGLPQLDDVIDDHFNHEGDWELVVIRVDARTGAPTDVAYSQHKTVETRRWAEVRKEAGRAVLYPARGTHAGLFEPSCGAIDCNVGQTPPIVPAVQPFGTWGDWPGRYGTIPAPCTRAAWVNPAALFSPVGPG